MSEAYLGEIRMFAGTYAPVDWHFADGALLSVSQYQALFALFGTAWGGDGINTFALPDLCGRLPVGAGQPTVGGEWAFASYKGAETVALTDADLPVHNHPFHVTNAPATSGTVGNTVAFGAMVNGYLGYVPTTSGKTTAVTLNPAEVGAAPYCVGYPHENRMSGVAINYIVCLAGQFPTEN